MTGRAKWDAWKLAQETYDGGDKAEARYLDIARSLGWVEGALPSSTGGRGTDADIWDDESTASHRSGNQMGKSVSAMLPPPEAADKTTIHYLSVSDDAVGLSSFLLENPATDVNERDQFVRISSCLAVPPLIDDLWLKGYTSLHLACDRGSIEVVKILLGKGADPSLKVCPVN
jgi:hypothetical protein